jgi:CRP-like cAMP-binding protein
MSAAKRSLSRDDKKSLLDKLGEYPLFKSMTGEQIEAARSLVKIKTAEAGESIWHENDLGDDLVILLRGDVDVTHSLTLFASDSGLESGDKALIHLSAEHRPVLGEMAVCAKTPRSATLTATSDIIYGVLTQKALTEATEQDPKFGMILYRNLAGIIAHRLIESNRNVLKLTTAFSLALHHEI